MPSGMPRFSIVSSAASVTPVRWHSARNSCRSGLPRAAAHRERMLGRDRHVRDAVERVGTRRVDTQRVMTRNLELELETHRPAEPVRLHELDAFRPALEPGERVEQFLRVLRDAQVVHRDLALLDQRAGAPAATVDHLLVGEHGLVDRIPVDRAGLAVRDALLEHAQEQPLVPAVVLGVAGRELAAPVEPEAERRHLPLHVGDVVVGPLGRRHAVRHRRVLRGQAERVPAHRLQHVVALHAHVARQHVADRVVAHVPHVQAPARVRKHAQAVVLRARRILAHLEAAMLVPVLLGGRLDDGRVVAFLHVQSGGAGGSARIAEAPDRHQTTAI